MATRNSGKSGAGRDGAGRLASANPVAETHHTIDAELAALLEDEMIAAETPECVSPPKDEKAPAMGATGAGDLRDVVVHSGSQAISSPGTGSYLSTLPERPLPVTRRFGAIIMETPVRSVAGVEVVTGLPDPRTVPPGPGKESEEDTPLPAVVIRTEDQKSNVIKRLDTVRDAEWQRRFHAQIDQYYKELSEEFSTPPDITQKLLGMLREARQLMIDTPEEFGNAEYRVMQVATAIARRRQSRRQARFFGPWLFLYLSFWLTVFVAGLLFANQVTDYVRIWGRLDGDQLANLAPIFNTMLWGGIGGVVGAMYALWYHIADRQDFDKHYGMWYHVQPLMGLVLGAITFLILAGGFLVVQVNLADANASTGARLIPYLVAVLAGFKQDFVYEQLERVVSIFAPSSAKPQSSETN